MPGDEIFFMRTTQASRPFGAKSEKGKRDLRFHLRFDQKRINLFERRPRNLIHQKEGRNLRVAVEATVRQVKHPFPASKLPLFGKFRVSCIIIGSEMVTIVRRIQRYLVSKIKKMSNIAPKTKLLLFVCIPMCDFPRYCRTNYNLSGCFQIFLDYFCRQAMII